jgi:hypothetical protein
MPLGQGKRGGHVRSNKGCITCRQRRIKCDEEHPTCKRCIKAKLGCSYITTFKVKSQVNMLKNGRREDRILLPKRGDISSLTIIRPTATLPGETHVENQYLKYFHQETTSNFPSTWDWSVWNRLMLQGCHHEAFIRDAVVAIGALHKSLQTSAMVRQGDGSAEELAKLQRQFAYQTYGRALKRIQHAINTGSGSRDALIACLLIVCFESHTGDRYKAGYHAQHGLRIYYGLPLKDRPSEVEDDIADAFRNLDITVSTVYDDRKVETHEALLDEDTSIAASMPSVFSNLDEAKRFWHVIMRRCCHFISTTWAHTSPSSLIRPFKTPFPGGLTTRVGTNIHTASFTTTPTLIARQKIYYAEMCRWIAAFAPVVARSRRDTESTLRAFVTASMLQIQALNAKITLAGLLYVDEMGYDDHLDDFTSIISLSHDVVRIRNAWSSISYFTGLFVLDIGLVVPLFTLLLKCRDRKLRCQGIEILEQWHVEGWWDPLLILAICKAVIDVEEREMVNGKISAEARATLTGKCHRLDERRMLVQCVQRKRGGLRWTEKLVAW